MDNSKVKSDIRVRCYQFSLQILAFTDTLPNKRSAWIISDQLIRAATSIGANLIEGRASSSRLEFKKYYEIALKSANETVYWLSMLRDGKIANGSTIDSLIIEAEELGKMLGAGVIRLKSKYF